jgi:ribosomal protein S6
MATKAVAEKERDEDRKAFYEIGFLLVPDMTEEEANAKLASLIGHIESKGGVIKLSVAPTKRELTYQMLQVVGSKRMKWNDAYFGSVSFEYGVGDIKALTKEVETMPEVVRALVIEIPAEAFTPRERRIPTSHKTEEMKTEGATVPTEGEVLTEAELDKTIDSLIVE